VSRPIRVAHVATVDLTLRFLLLDQMRRLCDEGFEVTAISAPGPWVADLHTEGIRHIPWPHATRAWNPVADARAFRELLRIFADGSFDLVHTHNPKPGILGRVAARLAGVPCVVNTVHGLYATPEDPAPKRLAVTWMERLAALSSDLELYQSEEDLRWARKSRIVRPARSQLLGNGTDLSRFDASAVPPARASGLRRELAIPDGAPVIGMVGRMVAEKGYLEFFAAARAVRDVFPEVQFIAVGSQDPDKANAIGKTDVDRARGDVIFTGWRKDVRDLLGLMDIFVLPSWREGVPRSAIEAAAMGRAMVLTNIRGCREVARDGVEALLVPARQPQHLAEAITRLLLDPGLGSRLGAAARERAIERFDERRVFDRVVNCYEELLSRKGFDRHFAAHNGMRIRPAEPEDACALARLHRETLPRAFLPVLGDGFLRTLYRALATDEEAIALVAEEGGHVLGLAAGTTSTRRFYRRFVRRHGVRAAIDAAPHLIKPSVFRRARETASYPRQTADLPEAELVSIAVVPGARARGVGRALARDVLDGLAALGAERVKVVVSADNEPANRFYESLGFEHRRRMAVHERVSSNVWVIGCRSSSLSASASS
jgi:glycosyltransferase involved in cell wall biosynthesis/ribosomal protein S18 acetylase RimI-like enzyme